MNRQTGLTKQSLIAACAAAYAGSWLLLAVNLFWRIQTGADDRICPVGSQDFTDWCTIAEVSGAFLLVFLWALYALPIALALTVIPALALGRLAPILELRTNDHKVCLAQYVLAAASGVFLMLSLAIATANRIETTSATAGFVGAVVGTWAFRRARYRPQKPDR